jgi:GntR family transcriptional regulator/MocR family aminotransferase
MILPPELTERYQQRLGFYSCPVPVFDQLVIARYIDSGQFERHLNRQRRKMRG